MIAVTLREKRSGVPSSNFLSDLPYELASGIHVIYDGDCPFCSSFVQFQKLREAVGTVSLLNARERPDLVRHFVNIGTPLDDGMALIIDGRVYYGADCLSRLALMSAGTSYSIRLWAAIFRSPRISEFAYPILKFGRRMVLLSLGRGRLTSN